MTPIKKKRIIDLLSLPKIYDNWGFEMKKITFVITTLLLLGGTSAESAIFAKDGKMIFDAQGRVVMGESAAMQALKELGVSAKDAAQLTRFITNDSRRSEEIHRLNLQALSGKPHDARRQGSDEASRAEARQPRPKSPQAAAARRRSLSPVRSKSPVAEEINWEVLEDFMKDHKADPVKALERLRETDPRAVKRLCYAILDPEFYSRAQSAGIGVIKNRAMVSFCQDYMPERASLKGVKQKSREASPEREKIKLRHVEFPKQSASLAEQQRGLEEAQRALLENAKRLGRLAEVEAQMKDANANLRKAQEYYDNLTAAVMGMKEDLRDIRGFEEFNPRHQDDLPEIYINYLVGFLEHEGRDIQMTKTSTKQIRIIQSLLAQAIDNLMHARADLMRINREMLTLQ